MLEILEGDWNDLTEEERYELELSFQRSDEEDERQRQREEDAYYLDPEEEQEWTQYYIEQELFKLEAVEFYKKYLGYKGEKRPSPRLTSMFKNAEILNAFLNRCHGSQGAQIVHELQALIKLGCFNSYRRIEPVRCELASLGFDVRSKQNWSEAFGRKPGKKVEAIIREYQAIIERDR